ncbi:MAG: mucoidy inhibitor MuiA family protein [Candidatus Eisenbacteria bacterium]|jgi:uncharacterized protein (TIGR02231 family)|nr:mucoidy inhibitor MuiA family protein [Candidatus Eisenbacteria bacterium]
MISLSTRISAVTVFPDRARVLRTGTLHVEVGRQVLRVGPLPLAMDPESVRLSAHGSATCTLHGVEVRKETYTESPAEEVRELEREIELLETRVAEVEAQLALAKEERAALTAVFQSSETLARGIAFGKLEPDAHLNLVERLCARCAELDAHQRELGITRRELERALQKPRREIERLQSAATVERYLAVVEVEAACAGDLVVELSSLVRGASWSALYDFRITEGDEPMLGVGYLGQVVQETGESWDGIELVLSTARPSRSAALPELKPWYVAPRRPRIEEMDRAAKARPQALAAGSERTTGAEPESAAGESNTAVAAVATVETAGSSVTYRIPGMVTIPPDGSSHKVMVARFDLHPQLDYIAVPRLAEEVVRRARVTNESPYVFLAGSANLFCGDDFIGRASMDHVPQGGKIELFLGVCDQILVTRELSRRDVDRTFIGNRRALSMGYRMKVENLLDSPVLVVLRDQLPVPRDEEIKVKLEAVDPQPTRHDDLGLLTWDLSIPGRSARVVTWEFAVEHPRQMEVVGLD